VCALESWRGWSADQREAWRRVAGRVTLLDLHAWREDERRGLVEALRAQGGRSERAFVARYQAHARLDADLLRWIRSHG
jgi:hypothetical protein